MFKRIDDKTSKLSLLEVMLVLALAGIFFSFIVPRIDRFFERSRVDLAITYLQTLAAMQQTYWRKQARYAESFDELERELVVDVPRSSLGNKDCRDCRFYYAIEMATEQSFIVKAKRINSRKWTGSMAIDEKASLQGKIVEKGSNYAIDL